MKPVSYMRGRVIYREGDRQIDCVYFVTDGEFEVTKTIKSQETISAKSAIEQPLKQLPNKNLKVNYMFNAYLKNNSFTHLLKNCSFAHYFI